MCYPVLPAVDYTINSDVNILSHPRGPKQHLVI